MKKINFVTLLLIASASLGFALSSQKTIQELNPVIGSIVPQCQKTLFDIATGPEFLKCIPFQRLLSHVSVLTDPKIIGKVLSDPHNNYKPILEEPLVNFSERLCSSPRCSDKGIENMVEAIKVGCESDLSRNQLLQFIFDAIALYPAIRDMICYKNEKVFCWNETMTTVFDLPSSPITITGNPLIDSIAVADPNKICTRCNKDIVTTFFTFINNNDLALQILKSLEINDDILNKIKSSIAIKCGIEFEEFLFFQMEFNVSNFNY
ncbi:hypothetical protein RhiirA5_371049 [Rhizophagus irregularis]|uniref:Uncharacterized protein n=1 Tax=Rhizophagus irregularis TaxID=588596 RepID=A0A2I1E2C9_9GLOM|nr:hypothetical protein RhiirA5_371049 [Rhizophagus irregularis]PKC75541.1 hypothetical protein RhiirA1_448730 [Rhizophagus irregularis]PKY16294.1 hypothetical protein RhiirB3_381627 [Rhizophagus irregularis]CAB4486424.1 unnamed protein product [Rhizophagus irregularis]CAB5121653.1 unnamed protein product [Rhizophagus irregularis]